MIYTYANCLPKCPVIDATTGLEMALVTRVDTDTLTVTQHEVPRQFERADIELDAEHQFFATRITLHGLQP